ncbi:MAG: hypothetical protein ABIQ81_05860 [Novosphingobium sp.]
MSRQLVFSSTISVLVMAACALTASVAGPLEAQAYAPAAPTPIAVPFGR